MPTKNLIWLVSFVLALMITVWLLSQSKFHNISKGEEKKSILTDVKATQSNQVAVNAVFSDLPPKNAPLADTFKDLVQLSNSGNASASMRLFKELRKCALRQASISTLNGIYYHRPGQTDAEYTQLVKERLTQKPEIERALEYLNATDNLCKGVSDDLIQNRGDFLRQAAIQNDSAAKVCYAISYEIGPKYLSNEWFDYVTRWQQEAPYFAQQALDAGQPGILLALIDAYMPDDPDTRRIYPLSQIISPDAKSAYALSLIYAHLVSGAELQQVQNDLAKLSNMLQPNQLADARATADALWPRFQQAAIDAPNEIALPCSEFLSIPRDVITIQGGAL